jgi:SagB-type dehydrogenase family enzyme
MTKNTGQEFMHKTGYAFMGKSDQDQHLPQPPLELEYDSSAECIDLPAPDSLDIGSHDLTEIIVQRESRRRYSDEALSLAELTYLLWCTQGVKSVLPNATRSSRTVPSAGARHAFETYILVNNVEGLAPGLYRYIALEHKLILVNQDADLADKLTAASWNQHQVKHSAATFIWVAVTYRMTWRYQERGYRYLHLDAGHVCQNLYLAAEAIDGGVCAIAAFYDDEVNALLGLDGESQFVIYLATMGKV